MKQRAHPTVNTNITNVLSKIRGGGVVGKNGEAEQQNGRQNGDKGTGQT